MKVYRRALPKCLQKPWKTFIYWYLSDASKHSFTENEWRQDWNNTTANWNVFPITIAACSDAHYSGERELSWLPYPIARNLLLRVVLKWLAFEQRKKFLSLQECVNLTWILISWSTDGETEKFCLNSSIVGVMIIIDLIDVVLCFATDALPLLSSEQPQSATKPQVDFVYIAR